MSKTFRRAAMSSICMLIVAVMSLTGATYAWFTQGTYSKVEGMEVKVEAATGGVLVAANDTTTMPNDEAFTQSLLLDDLKATGDAGTGAAPVSTTGAKDSEFAFFTGEIISTSEIKTATSSDKNYIMHYLFLRNINETDVTVNLGNVDGEVQTNIKMVGETDKTTNAAGRIGLRYVDVTTMADYTLPAGSVGVAGANVLGETGYGIFANGSSRSYKAINAAHNKIDVNASELPTVTTVAAENFEIVVPARTTVTVELYIWLEGQDAACKNENADATFAVDLYFDKKAVAQNNG